MNLTDITANATMAHEKTHCEPIADEETLWETMAEELVSLIAQCLSPIAPGSPWLSQAASGSLGCRLSQLPAAKTHWAKSSIGAAHWVQLSRALGSAVPTWCAELSSSRRSHFETAACCRVIDSQNTEAYDWPLQVLRLREGPGAQAEGSRLSHATPIARQSLRLAYWAVAKDVHPDRLQLSVVQMYSPHVLSSSRPAVTHRSRAPCALWAARRARERSPCRVDALPKRPTPLTPLPPTSAR